MGFFDSVLEETVSALSSDAGCSQYRILKAYPAAFHQSPLSEITITVLIREVRMTNISFGDFLGTASSGEFYGKSAEIDVECCVWCPVPLGGEGAWTAAQSVCEALLFSGLGVMQAQCGEISYDNEALALKIPCTAKRRVYFGKTADNTPVGGIVVIKKETSEEGVN